MEKKINNPARETVKFLGRDGLHYQDYHGTKEQYKVAAKVWDELMKKRWGK